MEVERTGSLLFYAGEAPESEGGNPPLLTPGTRTPSGSASSPCSALSDPEPMCSRSTSSQLETTALTSWKTVNQSLGQRLQRRYRTGPCRRRRAPAGRGWRARADEGRPLRCAEDQRWGRAVARQSAPSRLRSGGYVATYVEAACGRSRAQCPMAVAGAAGRTHTARLDAVLAVAEAAMGVVGTLEGVGGPAA